jgi:sigma-B regulation protein RsbU (phosphoserine phosphatase)
MLTQSDTGTVPARSWEERLAHVVQTVREMSLQTDPQAMVRAYQTRMRRLLPTDRLISLSRRGLEPPWYRITRSTLWSKPVNPWKERDKLPVLQGGLLGELLDGDEPRIIDELRVAPDDPAREYFEGQRSLIAIPQYDRGRALNMVVLLRREPGAFDRAEFPDLVLTSNLFGRATHNLVLSSELRAAHRQVDEELQVVADIQHSLLPESLPQISSMQLAAHYQTSRVAGGDYYDFIELADGKWGILIADVAGHGTPAAVLMAITHSVVHSFPCPAGSPAKLLTFVNRRLAERYTGGHAAFVTAFYGVYDENTRELTYASAGHNPPRLKRCEDGSVFSLDETAGLPLGIMANETYTPCTHTLHPGDQIIFYTDGITEARNPLGEMFGLQRLDLTLQDCSLFATGLIETLLSALETFTAGEPADDDRTVLVAKVM